MIILYDAKVINTGDEARYHRIARYDPYSFGPDGKRIHGIWDDDDPIVGMQEITYETIYGRRFKNVKGNRVVVDITLGLDKRTQELLGMPFKAFHAQERRRESDYAENARLRKRIRHLEEITLWQLIKWKVRIFFKGA